MSWPDRVRDLWEAYVAKTEQLERERKPGAGILGLTPGPKDDPCHERFAEDAEQLLTDMLADDPTPEEVREVLAYIYDAPAEHRDPQTAYWMLQAVQGLTIPMIERMAPADARELGSEYAKAYPRRARFPVQKKVLAALDSAGKRRG